MRVEKGSVASLAYALRWNVLGQRLHLRSLCSNLFVSLCVLVGVWIAHCAVLVFFLLPLFEDGEALKMLFVMSPWVVAGLAGLAMANLFRRQRRLHDSARVSGLVWSMMGPLMPYLSQGEGVGHIHSDQRLHVRLPLLGGEQFVILSVSKLSALPQEVRESTTSLETFGENPSLYVTVCLSPRHTPSFVTLQYGAFFECLCAEDLADPSALLSALGEALLGQDLIIKATPLAEACEIVRANSLVKALRDEEVRLAALYEGMEADEELVSWRLWSKAGLYLVFSQLPLLMLSVFWLGSDPQMASPVFWLLLVAWEGVVCLLFPYEGLVEQRELVVCLPSLRLEETMLRQGKAVITVDRPFTLHLHRQAPQTAGPCLVYVSLAQRGAGGEREVMRFGVQVEPSDEVDLLPELAMYAPVYNANEFALQIWPVLAYYASVHGEQLRWSLLPRL